MRPAPDQVNCLGALWRGIATWYRRDALYRELAALDERGLKDIGITRSDIPAVMAGKFWRGGEARDGAGKVCESAPSVLSHDTPRR